MVQKRSYSRDRHDDLMKRVERGMVSLCSAVTRTAKANANQAPPRHPQVQTGTLRRSINFKVERSGRNQIVGSVGLIRGSAENSEVLVYGPVLELGRRDGTIPPYPYLLPAAIEHKGNAREHFR